MEIIFNLQRTNAKVFAQGLLFTRIASILRSEESLETQKTAKTVEIGTIFTFKKLVFIGKESLEKWQKGQRKGEWIDQTKRQGGRERGGHPHNEGSE